MKIIITGATGMVGEGILLECMNLTQVTEILSVSRKPCGIANPKLKEYLVGDFLSIDINDEKLKGYDACFFCAGISSVGISEEDYRRITYDTTLHFAIACNPNPEMSFIYVSGGGTDSSEKGRMAWARIKGKTENDLMKLPFRKVYNFRPGGIEPFLPLKPTQTYFKTYKYLGWLFPLLKVFAPNLVITLKDLAAAMINASLIGYSKNILEMKDMKSLAKAKV